MHKVKTVANNDQRKLISQLCLLEEILDSFCIVAIAFTANSLNFFDLTGFASGLNVLEVNFLILAEVDNRAEEVKQTFVAFERLKKID